MAKEKKKDEPKAIQTARLPDLVDICSDKDGSPVFLVKTESGLEIKTHSKFGDKILVPPHKSAMPWKLPRADEVIRYYEEDNDALLVSDIEAAIRKNCYLADERLYSLLSAWVLQTHLIDFFDYTPVISLYAVAARGKTRTGRTLTWISRRGIHTESIRQADIIRKADRFVATFFFDVMDIWKAAEKGDAQDILLARFNRGILTARVLNPEKSGFDDTKHFRCFGATIIATNEEISTYLDSRSINIVMQKADIIFDDDPKEKDFLPLKERATAFRARCIGNDLPQVPKPALGRLGDILKPLLQIYTKFYDEEKINEFKSLILDFEKNRADSMADSVEGKVIETLIELEAEVAQGGLMTSTIADKLNAKGIFRYTMSPITVGKRMKALGFESIKIEGERGYAYDRKLIDQLIQQYGLVGKKAGVAGELALKALLEDDDGE